ncbi:hypothetical protein [Hymenobacter cheonanensis]|uniref:hypothetical protein n=1 Tax=Hymenobacter sp. CA2-7 TaxID=3063993 RepID=UPI0027131C8A|nr:hypothetical protein [Hymenobacter sp. CA2-7]MDO7884652.1 hypothetical protein [Hymenobacter sp. CA2-7]
MTLVDLPGGAAPGSFITVVFDVKPRDCPNPFNLTEKGVLPPAILGTTGFDITKIDVSTLKVNEMAPLRWAIEDVATPYAGDVTGCTACTAAGPDGIPDLTLKFSSESIAQTLSGAASGRCASLTLTGKYTTIPIAGLDYMSMKGK